MFWIIVIVSCMTLSGPHTRVHEPTYVFFSFHAETVENRKNCVDLKWFGRDFGDVIFYFFFRRANGCKSRIF